MIWRAATALGAMFLGLWSTTTAKADDQQLVQDYLQSHGITGAVVRPVTDDFRRPDLPEFQFLRRHLPAVPRRRAMSGCDGSEVR